MCSERLPHLAMGLLLALVHDLESLVWFTGIIFGAGRVRHWMRRRSAQQAVDSGTGVVLVGMGIKLALTR